VNSIPRQVLKSPFRGATLLDITELTSIPSLVQDVDVGVPSVPESAKVFPHHVTSPEYKDTLCCHPVVVEVDRHFRILLNKARDNLQATVIAERIFCVALTAGTLRKWYGADMALEGMDEQKCSKIATINIVL